MRPILLSTGPWQWWAYLIVAIVLAVVVAAIQWLGNRAEQRQPLTPVTWLFAILFVLLGAGAIVLLVNHIAPVYVHSYGVMLLIALGTGVWWLSRSGRRYGIDLQQWIDFALVVLLGGVGGARILYVLLNYEQYAAEPVAILYLWQGGLAFHGGVAGAVVTSYIFARARRLDFALLADLAAPAVALGYAIARIGCFLNGCCYGRVCELPWGVTFPPGTEAGKIGLPRHPTQFYASAASLIIFFILLKLQPRIKVRGNLFLVYLVLYSVYRFVVEFYRRGATAQIFAPLAPLTEAQAASIAIGVIALVWILLRCRSTSCTQENDTNADG